MKIVLLMVCSLLLTGCTAQIQELKQKVQPKEELEETVEETEAEPKDPSEMSLDEIEKELEGMDDISVDKDLGKIEEEL